MKHLLQEEMRHFDLQFKSLIESDFALVNTASSSIFKAKGKQLRSQLVFASFKIFQHQLNAQTYLSASLIEIIHTASLIHDDVIDQSDKRRGQPTLNFEKGDKTAILIGDYLMSNAFIKAYSKQNSQLLYLLVQVIKEMSEGELLQLQYQNYTIPTFEICERINKLKTASLFACCCKCGAYTSGASEQEIAILGEIGTHLGLAFQLEDDLLDLDRGANTGKPLAKDLTEGKITYPVLIYLQSLAEAQKAEFVSTISSLNVDLDFMVDQIYTPTVKQAMKNKINTHIETALSLLGKISNHGDTMYLKTLIAQIFPTAN